MKQGLMLFGISVVGLLCVSGMALGEIVEDSYWWRGDESGE
ncbi:MAG TPA: hypothetical protein PKH24_20645 [Sedimentisphaerales bacterium]|jgi:hypothetical protein|nr:hypothetical protein [Sedimentisphaerales bacterium]HNU31589.1 hypothetical protein [Sedimentisphaerales bacterium]